MASSVIKLQSPFERLKLYNTPEIALRKAIILQAIIDASNTSDTPEGKKLEKEAKDWLFGDSEDFKKICYEANMTPQEVVNIASKLIEIQHIKAQNYEQQKIERQERLLREHAIIFYAPYRQSKI